MKTILFILFALIIPGGITFSIDADTVWKRTFDERVRSYKISPDYSSMLTHSGEKFFYVDSETGNIKWEVSSKGVHEDHYFFFPEEDNEVLVCKDMQTYYFLDLNTGTYRDSIIVESAKDTAFLSMDLSFDGRYIAMTYFIGEVDYIFYPNGDGGEHFQTQLQIIDLNTSKVIFNGLNNYSNGNYKNEIYFSKNENKLLRRLFEYKKALEDQLVIYKIEEGSNFNDVGEILIRSEIDSEKLNNTLKGIKPSKKENALYYFIDTDSARLRKYYIDEGKEEALNFNLLKGIPLNTKIHINPELNWIMIDLGGLTLLTEENFNNSFITIDKENNEYSTFDYYFLNNNLSIVFAIYNQIIKVNFDYILSTENNNYSKDLYPNPTTHLLNISFDNKYSSNFKASLISLNGFQKTLDISFHKSHEGQTKINTSELEPGVYFLKVYSDRELFQFKFIKE